MSNLTNFPELKTDVSYTCNGYTAICRKLPRSQEREAKCASISLTKAIASGVLKAGIFTSYPDNLSARSEQRTA